MANDEFEDFDPEQPPTKNSGGNPLIVPAVFVFGILLLITLLYFAY